MITELYFF